MKIEASSGPAAKRWMIVDDDEGALLFMRQIVSRYGVAQIECFTSPVKALAAFKSAPQSFEMVITDFSMPGMDGIELSHHLRLLAPKIKILLITGGGLASAVSQQNFCGLLQKPFDSDSLKLALDAINTIATFAEPPALDSTPIF